jgi:hypothetical protein
MYLLLLLAAAKKALLMLTCQQCNLMPIMLVTVPVSYDITYKKKLAVMADMSLVYAAIHISVRIHPTEVQK